MNYSPTGGGTWRIFYYDEIGKYGDGAGTLYIKRDYDSSTKIEDKSDSSHRTYYSNESNDVIKAAILSDMQKFIPQWKVGDGSINAYNENFAAYLCYRGAWNSYVVSGVGKYAVGSPSVEMFIDAWNQFKGDKLLDYKWIASGETMYHDFSSTYTSKSSYTGYAVAPANATLGITSLGSNTVAGALTTEANNMFMKSDQYLWLASPSFNMDIFLCIVSGVSYQSCIGSSGNSVTLCICPVVCLGN